MFNKKILLGMATLSISTLLGATNSFASVDGFYLGGQIGWGKVHLNGLSSSDMQEAADLALPGPFTVTSNSTSTSDDGWAGRLYAGYQFDCHWAAELGWSIFSDVDTSGTIKGIDLVNVAPYTIHANGSVDIDAVDLVVKGMMPLQNNFSVYGKLGVAYVWSHGGNASASIIEPGIINATGKVNLSDEHKFFPTFGVGVAYDITPNVVADIAYNRIQKVGSSDLGSTDMATVGIAYHFG